MEWSPLRCDMNMPSCHLNLSENFYCGAFCFILTFYIYGYHMLGCVPQAVRRETFGDLLEQEVLFSNVLPSWQC